MGEEAPRDADGPSAGDARLLEVLQLLWEDVYSIGYDAEEGWCASRVGVTGHLITATDAEGLGKAIIKDFGDGR